MKGTRRRTEQWPFWICCVALWFAVVFAIRNQRDYQDSWILEGIGAAVLLLVVAFVFVVATETNSSRLALLAASCVAVLRLIPGLKYRWAYGTTTGLALHIGNVHRIMLTGYPPLDTPYSNVPGMHLVLSALALVSQTTAEEVVKYGFPIVMSLMVLQTYFLCCQMKLAPGLCIQIIAASVFAFDPHIREIEGTSFGTLLINGLLVWLLTREFGRSNARVPATVALIGAVMAITFSHAVTSLVLVQLLAAVTVFLGLLSRGMPGKPLTGVVRGTGRLAFSAIVSFFTWWMYRARFIFDTFVTQIGAWVLRSEIEKAPIPSRLFQLPLKDGLIVLYMIHGNSVIVFLLACAGLVVLWRSRRMLSPQARSILIALFAFELGFALVLVWQLVASFGTLEYTRIIGYAVALAPFFVGATLWRIHEWNRGVWGVALLGMLVLSLGQVFPYQPLMPGGDTLLDDADPDEPVLYLHTVTTGYQVDKLAFVKLHSRAPDVLMTADKATRNTAWRFWGIEFFRARRLRYWTGTADTPLDDGDWQVLLLHRPGIAGPLGEPLEVRTRTEIDRILAEPGRSVVYSNGESFVLTQAQDR